jgi:hypothetical protein
MSKSAGTVSGTSGFWLVPRSSTTHRHLELQYRVGAHPGQCVGPNADREGENDRSLIASDIKTRSLNQVPAVRSSHHFQLLPVIRHHIGAIERALGLGGSADRALTCHRLRQE